MKEYDNEEYYRNELAEAEENEERSERISGGREEIFNYYVYEAKGLPQEEQEELEDDIREELEEAGVPSSEINDIIEEWYEVTPSREELFEKYGVSSDEELEEAMDNDDSDYD